MEATYPRSIKLRKCIDPKLGVKSSLRYIRQTIATLYVFYIANGKDPHCFYSTQEGDRLVISRKLAKQIKELFPNPDIINLIEGTSLFKSQYESIFVFMSLVYSLGVIKFNEEKIGDAAERTGSKRFAKNVCFSTNMIVLDTIISSYSKTEINDFIYAWLRNEECKNSKLEGNIKTLLQIFSEQTVYKLRTKDGDLILQTEGIYDAIIDPTSEIYIENTEPVGPFRIIKSALDKGMNPYLSCKQGNIVTVNPTISYKDFRHYRDMVSTTLDINTRKQTYSASNAKLHATTIKMSAANTIPYLSAIRTKPFVLLAGISGTGKSRIVRKLAQATTTPELQKYTGENFEDIRWTIHNPENFTLIQVKPNWHNSMDVVGYFSGISNKYVFTPFIRFIAKAWLHPDVPFFLCLDEMNLAPVEEYFAEYLSAIESRSKEGGIYKTDPIVEPLKNLRGNTTFNEMINDLFNKGTDDNEESSNKNYEIRGAAEDNVPYGREGDIEKAFIENGITLPENLIVVGTVNMDETTFSFSRKVLDRAMSIEMNEVDYDAFLEGNTERDIPILDKETSKLLINRPVKGIEVKDGIEADKVISYLKRINELLDGTQFKLGYRAANEALLYVSAEQDFGQTDIIAALDDFTLMKILSRIEGDETKLKVGKDKNILEELAKIMKECLGKPAKDVNGEEEEKEDAEEETQEKQETRELKSRAKIKMMIEQLERDHFVSYWN